MRRWRTEENALHLAPGFAAKRRSAYGDSPVYYADNEKGSLALSDIDSALSDNDIYAYLYVEDTPNEWNEKLADKLVPVYDPALLYEEEMDFDLYVKQFSI